MVGSICRRCVGGVGGAGSAGGNAPCAALCARGGGGAGDDASCATLCSGGCGRWVPFAGGVSEVLGVLEAVGGGLCLLEAMEAMGVLEVLGGWRPWRASSVRWRLRTARYSVCWRPWRVGFGLSFEVSKFPLWQFATGHGDSMTSPD